MLCVVCVCFCTRVYNNTLGCQYQCKWLTGKTRLQNDLQCVDGDVNLLTHSLTGMSGVSLHLHFTIVKLSNCYTFLLNFNKLLKTQINSVTMTSSCKKWAGKCTTVTLRNDNCRNVITTKLHPLAFYTVTRGHNYSEVVDFIPAMCRYHLWLQW